MNAELVSGAVAGALGGAKQEFDEQRRLKQQQAIADMKAELQTMLAQVAAGSHERVAETGADAKRDVAATGADAKRDVAATAADAQRDVADTHETGASTRKGMDIDFGYDKLFRDSEDRRYGVDTTAGTAREAEKGRNSRWMTPSGNARLSSDTTRRGQDIGSETTRRGQDVGASTSTRGQDLSFSLGTERNKIADRRSHMYDNIFGPDNVLGDAAAAAPAGDPGATAPPPAPVGPAAVPAAPVRPPVVPPKPGGGGALPITPRAAAVPPKPKVNPALQGLVAQATSLLAQFSAEPDPAKKKALGTQLAALRQQIVAARGQ